VPITSKAQQRLAYAAANTKGGVGGMPQSVGKEFVAAGPAGGSFAKLPAVKKPKSKTGDKTNKALGEGRISAKALATAMARRQ
jgi:hypothetical protein